VPSSVLIHLRRFLGSHAAIAALDAARLSVPALRDVADPAAVMRELRDATTAADRCDALAHAIARVAQRSRIGADVAVAVVALALAPQLARVRARWGSERDDAHQELVLAVAECLRRDEASAFGSFRTLRAQVAMYLGRQLRARGHALSSQEPLDDDALSTAPPVHGCALVQAWTVATSVLSMIDLQIIGSHLALGETFPEVAARLGLSPIACRLRFSRARRHLATVLTSTRIGTSPRRSAAGIESRVRDAGSIGLPRVDGQLEPTQRRWQTRDRSPSRVDSRVPASGSSGPS